MARTRPGWYLDTMTIDLFNKLLFTAVISQLLSCLPACKSGSEKPSTQQMQDYMEFLERGQAGGELILTSDGTGHVYAQQSFGLGGRSTSLSFSGRIDFGTHKTLHSETTSIHEIQPSTVIGPPHIHPQ